MEYVDIYNARREKTGVVKDRNQLAKGEYRTSAHIWIMNSKNEILIQKRSLTKDKFPGMWAQTGGGVIAGESSKDTVVRECKEELGLDINDEKIVYVASYVRIRDIVDVWLVLKDFDVKNLVLQKEELEEVKMVSLNDFDKMIKNNLVVPSINPSYLLFKNYITNYMNVD